MEQPAHAPYAPSAMERIAKCPASYRASAGYPVFESQYASDGTEAHQALEWLLERNIPKADYMENNLDSPLHKWQHRKDTKEQRLAALQDALDYVYEILDGHDDAVVSFEERVIFPSMVTADCWGTADIIIIIPSFGWLYVIDFKYGAGVNVEVIDNLQIGTYASGALSKYDQGFKIVEVTTVIMQPRAWTKDGKTVRIDVMPADYYRNEFVMKIDTIILATMDENAPFAPGVSQCRFCPRKADCHAREAAVLRITGEQFQNVQSLSKVQLTPAEHLGLEKITQVLTIAPIFEAWIKDVEKQAYALMRSGQMVPGYKLIEGRTYRQWDGGTDDTANMLSMLSGEHVSKFYKHSLVSITEAERMLVAAYKEKAPKGQKMKAAADAKRTMADLTTKTPSKNFRIVPISHPSPAINVAEQNFGGIALPPPEDFNESEE